VEVIFRVGQSEGHCEDGSDGLGSMTVSKLCSIRITGGFTTSAALHCCYYYYNYHYRSRASNVVLATEYLLDEHVQTPHHKILLLNCVETDSGACPVFYQM
jgi:hypothetical protein